MIYFLQGCGAIKIGFTQGNPTARLQACQTGCPFKLILLATMDGGIFEEKRLHKLFSHRRLESEWFSECVELMDFINKNSHEYEKAQELLRSQEVIADRLNIPVSQVGDLFLCDDFSQMKNRSFEKLHELRTFAYLGGLPKSGMKHA